MRRKIAVESCGSGISSVNFDNSLDEPGFLDCPDRNGGHGIRQARAMSDQAIDGYMPLAYGRDDALKVLAGGIAAGQ